MAKHGWEWPTVQPTTEVPNLMWVIQVQVEEEWGS